MRHGSGGWSTDPNAVERWRPRQVNGTLYGSVDRRQDVGDPWLSMIGLLAAAVLLSVWWLICHPVFTTFVASTVWLYVEHGPAAVAAHHLILSGLLLGWFFLHRSSFHRLVTNHLYTRWRAWWIYRRRWQPAMVLSGLAAVFEQAEYVPKIRRIRCDPNADHLLVVMLSGQAVEDYERCTDALAHTFGALWCRVRVDRPGRIWLDFAHHDPLTTVIPALSVPATPALAALPIGRREDGTPWTLTLTGTHVLVAGATNAGKGSVVWSLLRAVAPLIADGSVQAWVIDPKGGMEMAPGWPLYTRFACQDHTAMAELLEDAETLLRERANRLRGITRQHTPTPSDPLILVVVDEIAALTAYLPDRELRRRIASSLGVLLSQGRAVGVHVVAAVQDPRKDTLPMRDLFPTRIALRLVEADQVDLVLGHGARDRGAVCDRIPVTQPGTGYVLLDGLREPVRVRAAQATDADINDLAYRYPAPSTIERTSDAAIAAAIEGWTQ
jgi:S-DNA-T family DNA segregation ATPase FtsK/SpoIIIE